MGGERFFGLVSLVCLVWFGLVWFGLVCLIGLICLICLFACFFPKTNRSTPANRPSKEM